MTEFVKLNGEIWPTDTDEQISAACRRMSELRINSTHVWRGETKTHYVLLADTDVDPAENGT